jgi:hypothetical protein
MAPTIVRRILRKRHLIAVRPGSGPGHSLISTLVHLQEKSSHPAG